VKTGKSYVRSLIEQGESQYLDFKFEISDSRKIAKSISAFSNTDGGILLIGVKDNGVVSGVRSEEELYMAEAAARMYCIPAVKFVVRQWNENGKTVLEIKIPKLNNNICYVCETDGKEIAYVRVSDQNLVAPLILLKVWKRKLQNNPTHIIYTEKEKWLLDFLSSNEKINLNEFRKIAKLSKYTAETVLVNLIMLDIVELFFENQEVFFRLK
jgi:predicted HTH transcriptional regulator